jgi:hypothetical protein
MAAGTSFDSAAAVSRPASRLARDTSRCYAGAGSWRFARGWNVGETNGAGGARNCEPVRCPAGGLDRSYRKRRVLWLSSGRNLTGMLREATLGFRARHKSLSI